MIGWKIFIRRKALDICEIRFEYMCICVERED